MFWNIYFIWHYSNCFGNLFVSLSSFSYFFISYRVFKRLQKSISSHLYIISPNFFVLSEFLASSNLNYFTSSVLIPSACMRLIKGVSKVTLFEVKNTRTLPIISSTESEFDNFVAFLVRDNSIIWKYYLWDVKWSISNFLALLSLIVQCIFCFMLFKILPNKKMT